MPMTTYTGETEIITNLGTTPAERGLETDEFKAKFDEGLKAFVTWFNDTHKTEFDAHLAEKASSTVMGHVKVDNSTIKATDGVVSAEGLYKIGVFTRDMSLDSGTQEITGVGFAPKCIEFFAVGDGVRQVSWGFDTPASEYAILDNDNISPGTYMKTVYSIEIKNTNTIFYRGYVASNGHGSDGFTITWVKVGSPTGIITVIYKASR
jgi:hypothetical protein